MYPLLLSNNQLIHMAKWGGGYQCIYFLIFLSSGAPGSSYSPLDLRSRVKQFDDVLMYYFDYQISYTDH